MNIVKCTPSCVHGLCIEQNVCKCEQGYTGSNCSVRRCKWTHNWHIQRNTLLIFLFSFYNYIVNEDCSFNLCNNNGTCKKVGDSYLCICPLTHTGLKCDIDS